MSQRPLLMAFALDSSATPSQISAFVDRVLEHGNQEGTRTEIPHAKENSMNTHVIPPAKTASQSLRRRRDNIKCILNPKTQNFDGVSQSYERGLQVARQCKEHRSLPPDMPTKDIESVCVETIESKGLGPGNGYMLTVIRNILSMVFDRFHGRLSHFDFRTKVPFEKLPAIREEVWMTADNFLAGLGRSFPA